MRSAGRARRARSADREAGGDYAAGVSVEPPAAPALPHAGLCDSCRHQRVVPNTRGSRFSLCERSQHDAAYPRYPRLPVLRCAGHEPRERPAAEPTAPPA